MIFRGPCQPQALCDSLIWQKPTSFCSLEPAYVYFDQHLWVLCQKKTWIMSSSLKSLKILQTLEFAPCQAEGSQVVWIVVVEKLYSSFKNLVSLPCKFSIHWLSLWAVSTQMHCSGYRCIIEWHDGIPSLVLYLLLNNSDLPLLYHCWELSGYFLWMHLTFYKSFSCCQKETHFIINFLTSISKLIRWIRY